MCVRPKVRKSNFVGTAWVFRKLNIAMENGPFEDDFPIKIVMFHCYVSLPEVNDSREVGRFVKNSFVSHFFQVLSTGYPPWN